MTMDHFANSFLIDSHRFLYTYFYCNIDQPKKKQAPTPDILPKKIMLQNKLSGCIRVKKN